MIARWLGWAAGALLALAGLAPRAEAEGRARTFALEWVRGPGAEACISSAELAQRLVQIAGPVLSARQDAERVIEGSIAREPDAAHFVVSVRVLDAAGNALGERSFTSEAEDCAALTDSILLVTAILTDARPQPPVEEAEPSPAPPPVRPVPSPVGRVERQPSDDVEVALLGTAALGLQPQIGPGAGATVWIPGPRPFAIEVGSTYWFSRAAPIDRFYALEPDQRRAVDFQAVTATLSACFALLQGSDTRVDACAGAAVGARWLNSPELAELHEAPRVFAGPALGLDLRHTLSRDWFLLTMAHAHVGLPRAPFMYRDVVGNRRSAFQPAPIAAWLGLGIGANAR